jgi:hypothetical protein
MPAPESPELVKELFLPIKWHPGFAQSQKEKNIEALHEAAKARGIGLNLSLRLRQPVKTLFAVR